MVTAQSSDPVTVLYIMGAPRSGSTLLDIVLGAHPDVVSVGELSKLPEAGPGGNRDCACGEHGSACPFWRAVRKQWSERLGRDPEDSFADGQRLYTRPTRLNSLPPPLLSQGGGRPDGLARFLEELGALYHAIASVSGKRVIVDSSKSPARALALVRVSGLDVRLVHLVRDGRGVVHSLGQSFARNREAGLRRDIAPQSAWRSSWGWRRVNQSCEKLLALAETEGITLRYEDLVSRPAKSLGRVGARVGLDFGDVAAALEAGSALPVGHLIAGNRLRMGGEIRLDADERWRREMRAGSRRVFWLVAGDVARRYGYHRA